MSFEQKNSSTDTPQKHQHQIYSQLASTTENSTLHPSNYNQNHTTLAMANSTLIQPLLINNVPYNRPNTTAYSLQSNVMSANSVAPVSGQLNFLSPNNNIANNYGQQLIHNNASTSVVGNEYNPTYSQLFSKQHYPPSIYDNPLSTSAIPFYNPGNAENTQKASSAVFRPLYTDSKNRFLNEKKKRARRKHDEIERLYICNYNDCKKGYGTLNHLNAHVLTQNHGQKRRPEEFKELRQQLRERKKKKLQQMKPEKLIQSSNNLNSLNTSYLSNNSLAGNAQYLASLPGYDVSTNPGFNSGLSIQQVSSSPQQQYIFNDRQLQIPSQPYLIYNPSPQQFAYQQQQKSERDNTYGISGSTSFDIPHHFPNLPDSTNTSSSASIHGYKSSPLPQLYSNSLGYSVAHPILPYSGISAPGGTSISGNLNSYGVISSSVPSASASVSGRFLNSNIYGTFDSSSAPTASTSNSISLTSSSKVINKDGKQDI